MRKHLIALALCSALIGGTTATAEPPAPGSYQGKSAEWWAKRAVQARKDANARMHTIRKLKRTLAQSRHSISPTMAIRIVFGRNADEALRVSWCESRWYPGAQNGQYLGLFQMGRWARSRYGHGADALTQAQAAYRYFRESGWAGWECKP